MKKWKHPDLGEFEFDYNAWDRVFENPVFQKFDYYRYEWKK